MAPSTRSGATGLSSPPITPADNNDRLQKANSTAMNNKSPGVNSTKRKRGPKSITKSVDDGWDTLPHGMGENVHLVTGHDLEDKKETAAAPPKKRAKTGKTFEHDDSVFEEVTVIKTEDQPKKRSPTKKASGSAPKKEKVKAHPYGLTPGRSPFPDHVMPTTEACEEVHRLLKALHDPEDKVKPPKEIPPPSMEVTGCGEVPDLLDALFRTMLSAATSRNNSNMSMQGLRDKFGIRAAGLGKGSINWDAIHEASLSEVIEAIKRGGLAKSKGTNIKAILDIVYKRNKAIRDALWKEKETGKPAVGLGVKYETQEQKDAQLARFNETLLAMDYVFEMTSDEAMDEMTTLPGVGVKTASCVILFNMQRPSFAVDTHVWRHCKWLGWVPENANRDKTFSHCEVRIPDHLKYALHQLFIKHGSTCGRCRANTSPGSEDFENTICPIEHLVKRTGKRKVVKIAGKTTKSQVKNKAKGKRGKKAAEETEESASEESDDDADHHSSELSKHPDSEIGSD